MAVVRGGMSNVCPHASAAALQPAIRPGRRRLDVAFHAGNLACEQEGMDSSASAMFRAERWVH